MASSNAHHRSPDSLSHSLRAKHNERHNQSHHNHHNHHRPQPSAMASMPKSMVGPAAPVNYLQHHLAATAKSSAPSSSNSSASTSHFKGHQRRQSVARLLPDISKLRLLSWLVEASSELINCDIAIMDGVYAKLNRSRESLLFWDSSNNHINSKHHSQPSSLIIQGGSHNTNVSNQFQPDQQSRLLSRRPPPPLPPASQPVAGQRLMVAKKLPRQSRKLSQSSSATSKSSSMSISGSSPRTHHSLPMTNYDASSLVTVLTSPEGSKSNRSSMARSSVMSTDSADNMLLSASFSASSKSQEPSSWQLSAGPSVGDEVANQSSNSNNNLEDYCDSNQSNEDDDEHEDDDDDDSSAASSSTSSGIHGGGTSLSSGSSLTSSSGSSPADSTGSTGDLIQAGNYARAASSLTESFRRLTATTSGSISTLATTAATANTNAQVMSSAEILSEKIRLTVMRHNYLQSLLVNIIRQHDKQRDQVNYQRRRLMSLEPLNSSSRSLSQQYQTSNLQSSHQDRFDFMDIADALNDGCLCLCHSMPAKRSHCSVSSESPADLPAKASTLPSENQQQQIQPPARKLRGLKKSRSSSIEAGGQTPGSSATITNDMDRQDIIALLSDKLCGNCFETHYWLHATDGHELPYRPAKRATIGSSGQNQDLAINVARRNAYFIRLVQQEVRSTITKSIELIDLIRKEIKSPESIKQKQLMRCFSSSIQLLTSVSNYVVPDQDISTFIPELFAQQETRLFSLPSSDFDHLMLNPFSQLQAGSSNGHQPDSSAGYHLAQAQFWQSSKFNIIKKLLQVKEQRILKQQSKDRRIYNNKIQRKFRLVMMDLTHFNRSQQLLSTENGVNSLLTSMRNVLEFGLYLTVKLY